MFLGDTNGDYYPELYVGNFLDKSSADPVKSRNFYYINKGDGTFIHREDEVITSERNLTYGVSFIDYDQDNDLDLFISNIARTDNNRLYENDGSGNFKLSTSIINSSPSRPSKGHTWGDFDNDSDLDLFVANGTEGTPEEDIMNYLFINSGDGNFWLEEIGPLTQSPNISAGTAWADFDKDGDLDIFLANWGSNTENNILYRNDLYDTNWLEISLIGTDSNRFGIGSKVRVYVEIGGKKKWLTRWLLPQTGYASQNEPIIHFGLGDASEIIQIEITWPNGHIQLLKDISSNQILKIKESE